MIRANETMKSPLLWVIEAFSVVSAIAFVVSGIGNALAFWIAWRINYFMVASPSDIIMSGFVIIAILTAGLVFALSFSIAAWLIGTRILRINLSEIVALFRHFSIIEITLAGSLLSIIAYTIYVIQFSGFSPDQRTDAGLSLLISITSEENQRYCGGLSTFSYTTGLRVAPSSKVDAKCSEGSVLWAGADTLMVQCEYGPSLVHRSDEVALLPDRLPRSEDVRGCLSRIAYRPAGAANAADAKKGEVAPASSETPAPKKP